MRTIVATIPPPMGHPPHSTAAVMTRGQKNIDAQMELHHGHHTILEMNDPVPNFSSIHARTGMVMSSK